MNRMLVGTGLIGLACLLGVAGCATEEAGMQPTSGGSSMTTAAGTTSDALSDSLKACLARIPSGSSAGARMVAEQSCRDNETPRQGVVGTRRRRVAIGHRLAPKETPSKPAWHGFPRTQRRASECWLKKAASGIN